jgi:hypothetical protein
MCAVFRSFRHAMSPNNCSFTSESIGVIISRLPGDVLRYSEERMDEKQLRTLLDEVRSGATGIDAALERMRHMPFEDLGFAKVDHHRALRHGMPEVIFGKGKTADQISSIAAALLAQAQNVLVTRADPGVAAR